MDGLGYWSLGAWVISGGVASLDGTTPSSQLYQTIPSIKTNRRYQGAMRIVARSAGNVRMYLGTITTGFKSFPGRYLYWPLEANGQGLTIQAVNSFNGSVDDAEVRELF